MIQIGMKKLKETASVSVGMQSLFGMKPLAGQKEVPVIPAIYDILLEWEDNSDNETSFVIEHSLDGFEWNELVTVDADTTSYMVTQETDGIDPSALNSFRVKAVNDAGASDYSNIAEV